MFPVVATVITGPITDADCMHPDKIMDAIKISINFFIPIDSLVLLIVFNYPQLKMENYFTIHFRDISKDFFVKYGLKI